MLYRLNSLWSNKISFCGCCATIWRHSSLPMLPPAPETKTTLLVKQRASHSVLGGTGSRPKRSSISNSLKSFTVTRPLARSAQSGKVRICTGNVRRLSIMALRRVRAELGKASRMSVTSDFCIKSVMPLGENTRTPLMLRPALAGSSSTKPTKEKGPAMAKAAAVCAPAVPAPKIRNRLDTGSPSPPKLASQNRAKARLEPTNMRNISGCKMPRLRGTPGHCRHIKMANSRAPYTPTAFAVVISAACPV